MPTYQLNGALFADMVKGGTDHLRANKQLVNDLNVFPIPDGDTGDNMALTMEGGDAVLRTLSSTSLSQIAEKLAQGMLLGARGTSPSRMTTRVLSLLTLEVMEPAPMWAWLPRMESPT